MVKVSFKALFLAAIGYKGYNPSVVGKWYESKNEGHIIEFKETGVFIQIILARDEDEVDFSLSGSYSIYSDTLVFTYDSATISDSYLLGRQNNRKLIIKTIPKEHAERSYK